MQEIEIQRDGLTLRGILETPAQNRYDLAILMHGFSGNCGRNNPGNMHYRLAKMLKANGIASLRFDFDGHGESDGNFCDMTVSSEIADGEKILEFARKMKQVNRIILLGHSQGGVVASMLGGYYHDYIDKLVLLAPAATLKDDALVGHTLNLQYDPLHIPDKQELRPGYNVGGFYLRTAQMLPIYEVSAEFTGKVCIIHGTNDQVVNPNASRKYHRCYENSELHLIEGAGHLLEGKYRDTMLQIVKEFLTK